jgi:hypothetical protein
MNVNGTEANHCGACNYKCSEHLPDHAQAKSQACSSGKCQYDCVTEGKTEYVNVGPDATHDNIKCVDPKSDTQYCGASAISHGTNCSVNMPMNTKTATTCDKGICKYSCADKFVNVGSGNTANNIKCINPLTDKKYCGAIDSSNTGTECDNNQECVAGRCSATSCASDEHAYIENNVTKCEKDTKDHCGSHNNACVTHQSCTNKQCVCGDGYPDNCNGTCVNLTNDDLNNCGYCGYICSENVNNWGTGSCTNKKCVVSTCTGNYHVNGTACEENTDTNCGEHGKSCAETEHCDAGVCKCGTGEHEICGEGKVCCEVDGNKICKNGETCDGTGDAP